MKFKSALVTQVSGSIGGMTGSHNRGGLYFRARAIPTDPNTPAQAAIRAIFGALVQRWEDVLTIVQRRDWIIYANQVPLTGPLGDPVIVSGMNHYIRSNTARVQAGVAEVDDGPTTFNLGNLSQVILNSAVEATQLLSFSFTGADNWNAPGGGLISFIGRPQNLTINYFRGPYRFATFSDGAIPQVTPIAVTSPFAFVAGQRIFARLAATYPDGRYTQTAFVGPVVATA